MGLFEKDLLKGGEKELLKLKSEVEVLNTCETDLKALEEKEKEEIKVQDKKKVEIEKEVSDREKEMRKEVEAPFDAALAQLTKTKKEKEAEKEKRHKEEVQKRQTEGTAGLKAKKESLWKEIEKIADEDQIPGIGISKVFLTLFYPKTLADVIASFIGITVLILGSSFAVFKLCAEQGTTSVFLLICEAIIILFLLLYILLNNTIKEPHLDAFKEINQLRKEGNKTSSEIKKISKQVSKETDEDLGLLPYQEAIDALEKQIKETKQNKEASLKAFDADKEGNVEREQAIWNKYADEWNVLQQNVETAKQQKNQKKEELIEREKKLHEDYDSLYALEKNIFKKKVIEELLGYIQRNEAKTIGEALTRKKEGNKVSKQQ